MQLTLYGSNGSGSAAIEMALRAAGLAVSKPAHARVRAAARSQLHRSWEIFADNFGAEASLATPSPGALAFLATVVSAWSGSRVHLQGCMPGFFALRLARWR